MLNILFYFFSIVLLLSAVSVVITYNSIISVLFLILSFFVSSILLILLECEFLALLLVTIYVGAVAVLFLFVLMMLDAKLANLNKGLLLYFPFGVFINIIFCSQLFFLIFNGFLSNPYSLSYLKNSYCIWYKTVDSLTDVQVFGNILYVHYVFQFLIVGFILFLALVGVVYLVTHSSSKNSKNQTVFYQLSRNPEIF